MFSIPSDRRRLGIPAQPEGAASLNALTNAACTTRDRLLICGLVVRIVPNGLARQATSGISRCLCLETGVASIPWWDVEDWRPLYPRWLQADSRCARWLWLLPPPGPSTGLDQQALLYVSLRPVRVVWAD